MSFHDVSVVVVHIDGDRPRAAVLEVLLRQVEQHTIRLIDFLVVRRDPDGHYDFVEVDDEVFALAGLGLHAAGLLSLDDARLLCADLATGSYAALILVEPTWTERFSTELHASGADVRATYPVPGSRASAVWDSASSVSDGIS